MSTRSYIGKVEKDGRVKAIYCHWDGYISNNGRILESSYKDEKKIDELLSLGALSSLGEEIGNKVDFDKRISDTDYYERTKNQCVSYWRDRGEEFSIHESKNLPEFEKFIKKIAWDAEYVYLFNNGEWFVWKTSKNGKNKWKKLSEEVLKTED